MLNGDTIIDLVVWEYHGMPIGAQGKHMVLNEKNISSRSNKIRVVTLFSAGRGNFVFNIYACYLSFLLVGNWFSGSL